MCKHVEVPPAHACYMRTEESMASLMKYISETKKANRMHVIAYVRQYFLISWHQWMHMSRCRPDGDISNTGKFDVCTSCRIDKSFLNLGYKWLVFKLLFTVFSAFLMMVDTEVPPSEESNFQSKARHKNCSRCGAFGLTYNYVGPESVPCRKLYKVALLSTQLAVEVIIIFAALYVSFANHPYSMR